MSLCHVSCVTLRDESISLTDRRALQQVLSAVIIQCCLKVTQQQLYHVVSPQTKTTHQHIQTKITHVSYN